MEDKYFFGFTEKQIEELTPDLAAACVISRLTWLVEDVQESGKGYFKEKFVTLVLSCDLNYKNAHKLDQSVGIFIDQPLETFAESTNTFFIVMATVYAFDAIGECKAGRTQHAWILVLEAERYLGMAMGSVPNSGIIKLVKSNQGTLNNFKSKEKNRKIKADVLKYYKDNINTFSSMTDAAGKMENIQREKGEKVALNTILDKWLPEFHKENPSIPKPKKATPCNNK